MSSKSNGGMSLESAIVSFTIEKLGDILIQEAKLLFGVKGQIQSLQKELTWMYSHMKDVDERLEEGNETLRLRIREIRNISFDVEDVIDSFILAGGKGEKKNLLQRYACCFNYVVHTHQIAIEIEAIKTRISESAEMFQRYHIGQTAEPIQKRRPQISPNYNNDYIVGLENDTTTLVEKLTIKNDQISILCIVGMGGSGKTTLASKLYKHQIVRQHFTSQAWITISQEWNIQQILVDILRQVTGKKKKSEEIGSVNELLEELRECLEQTPYLIVLDDVWKRESLQALLPAFPIDNKRNKIIITTRNREVVQFPNLFCFFHEPPRLDKSESWELFSKIALYQRQSADIEDFKKLGKQMLKKCDGLPLAIVALGGILGAKETIREWERISKAVSARVMEGEGAHHYGTVKDMLALSYQELSYDLKPCFLYFALFPEDYVISVEMLIRMWVSEGFVISRQLCGEETLEDVAEQFVDELVQRCVIQVAKRNYEGRVKKVRIHDLMRDLCIKKAKEREFLEIFTAKPSQEVDRAIIQSRRVSICTSSSINIPVEAQKSHVQSLSVFGIDNRGTHTYHTHQPSARSSLETMYKNFRLLKVLNIDGRHLSNLALPDEIGNLILLRYLGLRVINACELPKSIENLRNLLTFDFWNFSPNNRSLPNVFWRMAKLRHLHIRSHRVPENRFTLQTLTNLQTLWGVMGGDWMLKEMSTLSPTVTKLRIHSISSMEQLETIFQCPSVVSGLLQTLHLEWNDVTHLQPQKLELLCCCHRLRKLYLQGRISEGPSLLVQFPSNLMKLRLVCTFLSLQETMSTLGKLSNLKHLELLLHSYEGTKWTCSAGEFPQVKHLLLVGLVNLERWTVDAGAMPRLSYLSIYDCQNMKRLPEGLRHITTLQELEIGGMPEEFYKRLQQTNNNGKKANQVGQDSHIIKQIPIVRLIP